MHHIRVLKSDCCGWSKSGLWPSSRCTSNKQNQSWRRRPAITDQMRWPTQSALWVCLDLTTSYKHIDDSECGCYLKTQTQVTITINHNGKRVKAPWHQHRGAIVTCFLWLTNYGLGSGGGIPTDGTCNPLEVKFIGMDFVLLRVHWISVTKQAGRGKWGCSESELYAVTHSIYPCKPS